MGVAYPELERAQALMTETLRLEEDRFRQTLDRGLRLLEEAAEKLASGEELPGELAFKLYDTYGFPLALAQDSLRGQGQGVHLPGFEAARDAQRERARAAWKGSGEKATDEIWFGLRHEIGATEFLGYAADAAEGVVGAIVADGK